MLSGRRGSSDDHPLLVTARDAPVRPSQELYGTREEGLVRGSSLQAFGEKKGWARGMMPRGCRPVACDPVDLDLHWPASKRSDMG